MGLCVGSSWSLLTPPPPFPSFIMQSKRVRRRKKPRAPAAPQPPGAAELEELWAAVAPQLQDCLQVGTGPAVGGGGGPWGGAG